MFFPNNIRLTTKKFRYKKNIQLRINIILLFEPICMYKLCQVSEINGTGDQNICKIKKWDFNSQSNLFQIKCQEYFCEILNYKKKLRR